MKNMSLKVFKVFNAIWSYIVIGICKVSNAICDVFRWLGIFFSSLWSMWKLIFRGFEISRLWTCIKLMFGSVLLSGKYATSELKELSARRTELANQNVRLGSVGTWYECACYQLVSYR